ncbi:MAG: RIP metalloprotease RseP [Pseudomonadota bacterium]
MDLISSIPVIGPFLLAAIPFIICLSIVVAIHELGHLMVGRWCGIKAEVFSVGFGRVLYSRRDRHGTVWQLALLPLGGFVKFVGDMDPSSSRRASDEDVAPEDRPHAFHNAALWRRTLTVLAGPVANFLLSIIIFFTIALLTPKGSDEPVIGTIDPEIVGLSDFREGDRVLSVNGTETPDFPSVFSEMIRTNGELSTAQVLRDGAEMDVEFRYLTRPRVTNVSSDGAAIAAGIVPGDMILAVNDVEIASSRHLILLGVDLEVGKDITVRVDRDGDIREFTFAPRFVERPHPETGEIIPLPTMGVQLGELNILPLEESRSFGEAAISSVDSVVRIITDSLNYIEQMLFKGATTDHLSGPIGIAKHSANAASGGWLTFVHFIAFISTAIGLMNLFPIPVLDGGHLMFYAAEAVRGRPANEHIVRYGTVAGLSLLLLLMVFVTFNNDLGLGAWLAQN